MLLILFRFQIAGKPWCKKCRVLRYEHSGTCFGKGDNIKWILCYVLMF